jgi:hypothetical protein
LRNRRRTDFFNLCFFVCVLYASLLHFTLLTVLFLNFLFVTQGNERVIETGATPSLGVFTLLLASSMLLLEARVSE